jgi:hypothetical protein
MVRVLEAVTLADLESVDDLIMAAVLFRESGLEDTMELPTPL